MYIIGMNGPPRAGKDTIGKMIADHVGENHVMPVAVMSLSQPMGKLAAGALGVEYTDEWYEKTKDEIIPEFGVTLRRFIINLSETHMKPMYGTEIWSRLLWLNVPEMMKVVPSLLIITNFGFQSQPEFFESLVGAQNVLTVQVDREGRDFSQDSRGYVAGQNLYHIQNNGSLEDAKTEAVRIYGRLLNNLGWTLA